MQLQFIEPEIIDFNSKEEQPASYVRRTFVIAYDKTVARAVLTATALGVYIPYVNGQRCSDELLLPGVTDYNQRLQYQVMDVTNSVRSAHLLRRPYGMWWQPSMWPPPA